MKKEKKFEISIFFNDLIKDKHHRFKSWEHCYSYFLKPIDDIDIDKACLHLSFYLASWGMYRGSSFLLWKDYLIHKSIVKKILEKKNLQNIDFSQKVNVDEIFELITWIKEWYPQNIKTINGIKKQANVSDTLVTKILLGTLGCIPAYDRYFCNGLKIKHIKPHTKLSVNNFNKLVDFYQNNKDDLDKIQQEINKHSKVKYPIMKLIDMYFWQIGAE